MKTWFSVTSANTAPDDISTSYPSVSTAISKSLVWHPVEYHPPHVLKGAVKLPQRRHNLLNEACAMDMLSCCALCALFLIKNLLAIITENVKNAIERRSSHLIRSTLKIKSA